MWAVGLPTLLFTLYWGLFPFGLKSYLHSAICHHGVVVIK